MAATAVKAHRGKAGPVACEGRVRKLFLNPRLPMFFSPSTAAGARGDRLQTISFPPAPLPVAWRVWVGGLFTACLTRVRLQHALLCPATGCPWLLCPSSDHSQLGLTCYSSFSPPKLHVTILSQEQFKCSRGCQAQRRTCHFVLYYYMPRWSFPLIRKPELTWDQQAQSPGKEQTRSTHSDAALFLLAVCCCRSHI